MRNLSYENEFYMKFHFHVNQNHFHKNGFALKLALKRRHKGTLKWPFIYLYTHLCAKAGDFAMEKRKES